MRKPREADLVEDVGHFAQELNRLMVGFPEFDSECLQGDSRMAFLIDRRPDPAATALAREETVVTCNIDHFERFDRVAIREY